MEIATVYRYTCQEISLVDVDAGQTYVVQKIVRNRKTNLTLFSVAESGQRTAVLDVDLAARILDNVMDQFTC